MHKRLEVVVGDGEPLRGKLIEVVGHDNVSAVDSIQSLGSSVTMDNDESFMHYIVVSHIEHFGGIGPATRALSRRRSGWWWGTHRLLLLRCRRRPRRRSWSGPMVLWCSLRASGIAGMVAAVVFSVVFLSSEKSLHRCMGGRWFSVGLRRLVQVRAGRVVDIQSRLISAT